MSTPALRRVLRRETHSPRTVAMIVAVTVVLLALLYLAVETVLSLLGQQALVVAPGAAARWLVDLPDAQPAASVIGGGVVLALLGALLVVLALAPGRLARHTMQHEDRAVVVDNGVIAAALAQRISEETGLVRQDVAVGVGHRRADIALRVPPGFSFDRDSVSRVAAEELDGYRLAPTVRSRVRIRRPGESEDER